MSNIVGARIVEQMAAFFTKSATVQTFSKTTDAWKDALVALPCRVTSSNGDTRMVVILGDYDVRLHNQVVVDGIAYDVVMVNHDSEDVLTRLYVREVLPREVL